MSKLKKIIATFSILTVLTSGVYVVNDAHNKQVALAIHLGDETINVNTKQGTVRDVLASQGIVLSSKDRVEPSLDTVIKKGDVIKVFKARDIFIKDGDNTTIEKTTYRKVSDILNELRVDVTEYDAVTPGLDSEVAEVDTITIVRAERETITTKEEIQFSTKEISSKELAVGERKVATAGQVGVKEITKEVITKDGEIVFEKVVSEKVLSNPVEEVVYVGAKDSSSNTTTNTATNKVTVTPTSVATPTTRIVLANGNTAGEIGSYAARQMEARTRVPAATWELIIARESNGQVNARNASGAAGLFQTMPGWGPTNTVEEQMEAAIRAYNNQGLRAWGM